MAETIEKVSKDPSKDYIHPTCTLVGTDSNVFNLLGKASAALRKAGHADMAAELGKKVFAASDFNDALCVIMAYVDVE